MQHFIIDTNDPDTFCAITEAGLRAFDRYHRNLEARTVTLSTADWHRVDDDTPQGGAQEAAR
ncbi:hypothetical protein A3734_06495 [Sulfitobacter sp. HI0054]|uniref:hypothetical protein n=1 Tax=Sulfitobacter sp. HI0054 TaxID=1822238 RepID=UPI0007C372E3|nr:hypothetical protein [Sulfitobacter sp. HI0054]KZY51005.1 hypothetical protein A3734_06495 [Sulfitobacter sp. HI0054]